ncbi:MAG: twin-arginine translocase subunit TatB [Rhodobacteraceae bacterium]|nr:twin-arginine translocase subunit TatB [Paracoccaceae bacterium]
MFDIGWTELLLIGIVALIVVGPNDMPGMFRTLGRFTGKARRMAREFQTAMNEAADQTGIKETAADLKNMTSPKKMGLDKLNEAAERFDKWEPGKPGAEPKTKTKPKPKPKPKGPETQKLSEERAEAAAKIRKTAAAKVQARQDAEMTEAAPAPEADAPAQPSKPAQSKPAQSKDAS